MAEKQRTDGKTKPGIWFLMLRQGLLTVAVSNRPRFELQPIRFQACDRGINICDDLSSRLGHGLQIQKMGGRVQIKAGPTDIAAHAAQVAVAGVCHDLLVTGIGPESFGDKAGAQPMRAEAFSGRNLEPRHLGTAQQDLSDRIRMQGISSHLLPAVDGPEERTIRNLGFLQPALQSQNRAGFAMLAPGEENLFAAMLGVGLAAGDMELQSCADDPDGLCCEGNQL